MIAIQHTAVTLRNRSERAAICAVHMRRGPCTRRTVCTTGARCARALGICPAGARCARPALGVHAPAAVRIPGVARAHRARCARRVPGVHGGCPVAARAAEVRAAEVRAAEVRAAEVRAAARPFTPDRPRCAAPAPSRRPRRTAPASAAGCARHPRRPPAGASAYAVQVVQVEQAHVAVLAALRADVRQHRAGRRRHDRDRGRAEIRVVVHQVEEVGRREAVGRQRHRGIQGGRQREHRVAPVVAAIVGVVHAVAGADEDAVGAGIVGHAGASPDAGVAGRHRARVVRRVHLLLRTIRLLQDQRIRIVQDEMHVAGVAAHRIEHDLGAGSEVDRGDVALVVAAVVRQPRRAAVHDIQVGAAVARNRQRERGGYLLDLRLERGQLGPAAGDDLGAVADFILVYKSIQRVVVDVLPARIERGRAGGRALVVGGRQRAGMRAGRIARPELRAARRVQRQQRAVALRHVQHVAHAGGRGDRFEQHRRARHVAGQRNRIAQPQLRHVRRAELRLVRVAAAVRGVETELQPVGGRRDIGHASKRGGCRKHDRPIHGIRSIAQRGIASAQDCHRRAARTVRQRTQRALPDATARESGPDDRRAAHERDAAARVLQRSTNANTNTPSIVKHSASFASVPNKPAQPGADAAHVACLLHAAARGQLAGNGAKKGPSSKSRQAEEDADEGAEGRAPQCADWRRRRGRRAGRRRNRSGSQSGKHPSSTASTFRYAGSDRSQRPATCRRTPAAHPAMRAVRRRRCRRRSARRKYKKQRGSISVRAPRLRVP